MRRKKKETQALQWFYKTALQRFYFSQQDPPNAGKQTHQQLPLHVQSLQGQCSVLTPSHPQSPGRCGSGCRSVAAPQPAGSPAGCVAHAGALRSLLSQLPAALPAAAALQSLLCPSLLQVSLKTRRNLQGKKGKVLLSYKQFLRLWGRRQTSKSRSPRTGYTVYPPQGNPFRELSLAGLQSIGLSEAGCRWITVHILP